ncbi:rhodanese-like domain-containing protein, partial [Thiomonas sp. SCN 64-16]
LPLTRQPTPAPTPSTFTPQLDDALLATRPEVAHALGHPSTLLLDARPRAFYLGREKAPAAIRPGTLPGALDFDNLRWFEPGSGALPAVSTLQRIAAQLPQQPGAVQIVSFCNTGHWAATNWFVLSEVLHRPHVALYPGSMVDWSRADAPMAHVPTRWQQLWQQLEQTWQAL